MEVSVLIEPVASDGFRASCGDPIPSSAEGATRDEALSRLREQIVHRVRAGVEVVKLRIDGLQSPALVPIWPDDQLTEDWLAGIAQARTDRDQRPDPWDLSTVDTP